MYSGARRRGLGSLIQDYSEVTDAGLANAETFLTPAQLQQITLQASAPKIIRADDRALRDGLLNGQQPGGALWSLVRNAIGVVTPQSGGISFADAIVQYPQLTGLLVAYMIYADGLTFSSGGDAAAFDTPDKVLALATTRVGQQRVFQSAAALPDALPASAAQPYLDAVAHYLNLIYADLPDAIAGERDNFVGMVLGYARQAALARGTTALGVVGGSGQPIVVATVLIHYQLECPDGTMFVVMNDVTLEPANRYVYTWLGPNWRPMAFAAGGGATERGGVTTCVGLVKGTGSWYTSRVFGLVPPGDSCDATPDTFTGPWNLITPDITAALTYQSGAPVHTVPPAQQVTNIAAPTNIPAAMYQAPNAAPASPGVTAAPPAAPPSTDLYQSPVTVPAATVPAAQYASGPLYQSPESNGAAAQPAPAVAPASASSGLGLGALLLIVGGVGYALSRRKGRGTMTWQ